MLFLAAGLVDVSSTYFPVAIAQYINPRSALAITTGVWYVLWTLYLGPDEDEHPVGMRRALYLLISCFLVLFYITSGLGRQVLESFAGTTPFELQRIEFAERLSPWIMLFLLVIPAYYGARQDYRRQAQIRTSKRISSS